MRELLIRYLLGELDPVEHDEVQQRLNASPELRRELEHLRSCFAAAIYDDEMPAGPPSGLAERTTVRVAYGSGDSAIEPTPRIQKAVVEPPAGALGWSLADLTVAGGVILAVSMLLFPALRESRFGTRRTECSNNQRELWVLTTYYANDHGGYVPRIESHENAAMFVVRLVDEGYARPEDMKRLLLCPGAPLADLVRAGQFEIQVPTSVEMRAMSPCELTEARRNTSPFFAFRFPYRVGPELHYVRQERLAFSPWFADTAGSAQDDFMSANHDGVVLQVMNHDGSVKSLTSSVVPGVNDNLFRNALGKVGAGCNRYDAVLGDSAATPGTLAVTNGR